MSLISIFIYFLVPIKWILSKDSWQISLEYILSKIVILYNLISVEIISGKTKDS